MAASPVLPRVRASCAALLAAPGCPVALGAPATLAAFLAGPYPALAAHAAGKGAGVDLPLALDQDEAIDACVLLCLLQFGSGFRVPLHAALHCGASDAMIRGLLGFLMVGRKPSAGLLAHLREHEAAEIWGLPLTVDEPVPHLPCVTMSKPGPLKPLAAHLARALNSCGRVLLEAQAPTFAAYLRANAPAWCVAEGGAPCIDAFVAFVAERFPVAFRDVAVCGGGAAEGGAAGAAAPASAAAADAAVAAAAVEAAPVSASPAGGEASAGAGGGGGGGGGAPQQEVWLLKKAQLLAKELGRKFGGALPGLFGWAAPGAASLTAFADNVLPCVLAAEGVLVLREGLAARIAAGEAVSRDEAAALRAGAVVACEALAAASGSTAEALDHVLWHAGKLEAYRALPRHVDTATCFY
jgi:hypothetical protein